MKYNAVQLLKQNTPQDLVLRGFSQDEILQMTGFDVGYHGSKVKTELLGIDRFAYKVAYVNFHYTRPEILSALDAYAQGLEKEQVLRSLGIAGANIVKLHKLFDALGYSVEFKDADKQQRLCSMRRGTFEKYGTENVFNLPEMQEKAAQTREQKYGGRYTLSKGSVLADGARATYKEHMVLSGCVLFSENSVEDLLLRGYGNVYIQRVTGISMRVCKSEYLEKIKDIDAMQYRGSHIQQRFLKSDILNILAQYGNCEYTRRNLMDALGLFYRLNEQVCPLCDLFTLAGYEVEYAVILKSRQSIIQSKIEQTNIQRYGGKTPMSSDSIKSKVKATTLLNYGVENVSQSDVIKQKKKDTTMKHYGVEHSLQSVEVQAKLKATIQRVYGVKNVSQSDVIKKKKAETTMLHYGVEQPLLSQEIRDKQAQTLREHYGVTDVGVTSPFQIKEILEKTRNTCATRYGVHNPFESKDVQAKIRQHWLNNYGVDNPSQVLAVQEKRTQTMLDRFGVENPFQSDVIKEKIKDTNIERYGVPYLLQNPDFCKNVVLKKIENGTMHTSVPEESLYQYLCDIFGENDVKRQYYSDIYPFACDFYIVSRDLFIELNGTWTHGGHWFNRDVDFDVLLNWTNKYTTYYDNAIHIWSESDVNKRQSAADNNLNYVVFWDSNLSDAMLWIAMGCPDGQDWKQEYSWLPDRQLNPVFDYPELQVGSKTCVAIAKAANGLEFYHRELQLWSENPYRKVGTVQSQLYANRYRYIGKLPDKLTDKEILRGLTIGGIVRGYSVFDNTGMVAVLKEYVVQSIYDPCAGWGERLATAGALGLHYHGCDINQTVVNGHLEIIQHYDLQNCDVVCMDAACHDMTIGSHDCVFTCPPYFDTEVYTSCGAENLDHSSFLKWWKQVVLHSVGNDTRVFAYQISQKYKDDMNQILLDLGWQLDKQIPVGVNNVSHMNRSQGVTNKQNYEEVQVFVRSRE